MLRRYDGDLNANRHVMKVRHLLSRYLIYVAHRSNSSAMHPFAIPMAQCGTCSIRTYVFRGVCPPALFKAALPPTDRCQGAHQGVHPESSESSSCILKSISTPNLNGSTLHGFLQSPLNSPLNRSSKYQLCSLLQVSRTSRTGTLRVYVQPSKQPSSRTTPSSNSSHV